MAKQKEKQEKKQKGEQERETREGKIEEKEIVEEAREEKETREEKEKIEEEGEEKKIEIMPAGVSFEMGFRERGRRERRVFLEDGLWPADKGEARLEESLKAIEIEKPKKEPVSEGPLYTPIYQEKTEVKYVSTASAERLSPSEGRELRAMKQTPVREARTPMLREVATSQWEEVTKYEKERVEMPEHFEPTFKHPEKKITKYKARY